MSRTRQHLIATLATALLTAAPPLVQGTELTPDLTELPLESLMTMTVTSVSKKAQTIMDAPAAVFVITGEDIRRSGATSIPDALRMVPGLEVARVDGNNWAITARGFNGNFANKLLVLMDGRSVYNNLYSGVFWDRQDTVLEDIDRIEVIRGPGAALWGANAVNGIINIITKQSSETTGSFFQGGVGFAEGGFVMGRQGFTLGQSTTARVYAKYYQQDGLVDSGPYDNVDKNEQMRGGIRLDSAPTLDDTFTFQADAMYGEHGMLSVNTLTGYPFVSYTTPTSYSTAVNLLGRWEHRLADASQISAQVYYDYDRNKAQNAYPSGERHTVDLDLQHRLTLMGRHDVVWGGGYRMIADRYRGTYTVGLDPDNKVEHLVNLFVQDDITLLPKRLRLIIGSKFEHNDYTGFEVQPNARLLWTPNEQQSLWASVSRAVRTPSRGETAGTLHYWDQRTTPMGTLVIPRTLYANNNFKSENVLAYEAGYRNQFTDRAYVDVAAFYSHYRNLRSLEPVVSYSGPLPTQIDIYEDNKLEGESYGVELSGEWHPTDWLRLQPAYTTLWMDLRTSRGSVDTTSTTAAKGEPRHQVSLRTSLDLADHVDIDIWMRFVDAIKALNSDGSGTTTIDPYVTVDVRLAWRPMDHLELSLVGRNLVEPRHQESSTEVISTTAAQVARSVYGMVTWRY